MSTLEMHLNYVAARIPFYARRVRRPAAQLQDFPPLSKDTIRRSYGEFISDDFATNRERLVEYLNCASVEAHHRIDGRFSEDILVEETSGSTGIAFRCVKTRTERAYMGLAVWKQRWQLDAGIRKATFCRFLHGKSVPFNLDDHSIENVARLYEFIHRERFRWLHTTSAMLEKHLQVLIAHGFTPRFPDLRFIECTAHHLSDQAKQKFQKFFGANVINQYGLTETWTVALTCLNGFHHVNEDNVHVEIIGDDGTPISAANELGRIVVTSLHLKLMPLVRYLTGDYGFYREETCTCGLPGRIIGIAEGGEQQRIKGVSGQLFGNIIFKWVLIEVHKTLDCSWLQFIRVIQKSAGEFVVYTNYSPKPHEFSAVFSRSAAKVMGKPVSVRHVILDAEEIDRRRVAKPWLFRCEC